jgi:hypothetical protein
MPNSFVVPEQVAATAVAMLRDDLKIARTVSRKFEANFGGGKGSVVNVRVPATLKARRRALDAGTAIVLDNVTEDTIAVSLDHMAYSAVPVTDEELTLRIEDFAKQILAPQVVAIAEDVENVVVETLQGVAEDTTLAYDAAKPSSTFVQARKQLRDLGVPFQGLYAAVGTGVYAELLEAGELKDASQSGSTAALRDAEVGRVRGFDTFEDNRLADDEIVFYHGDAVALAIIAPVVPGGVAFGQSLSAEGFACRWIKDYDSSLLQDRSILSTFVGCSTIGMKHRAADGTVSDVLPIIRVLTSTIPA